MRPERFVISRTDHIGDVVLTFPMVGILRRHFPHAHIGFLGRSYTRDVIEACAHVDEFLNWDQVENSGKQAQKSFWGDHASQVIIHVYPTPSIATAAWQARIPTRIGTSHRVFHWWTCNRRVGFTRRRSRLHEAQLNVKLLQPLGIQSIPSLGEIPGLYGLTGLKSAPTELTSLLRPNTFNVVIHPMTAGNAKAWNLNNYSRLIEALPKERYTVFITGVEADRSEIEHGLPLNQEHVTSLVGRTSLADLLNFISAADGIVCASTGPLHVAAALDKCAIGIYQPRGIGRPERYGPVGRNAHSLVYDTDCERCLGNQECDCLQDIPVSAILEILEPQAEARYAHSESAKVSRQDL